jgi:ubiquitin-activating enzyme E1
MSELADVNEKRFSRQLYVVGLSGQKKLSTARVLIIGSSGVGSEIAKNLTLAGIKHITLHDTKSITYFDLGGNCFLNETCIGLNRAVATLPSLKDLNPSVEIVAHTDVELPDFDDFGVVISADSISESKLIEYNEHCRAHGIGFIACEADGIFSTVFVDFGDNYVASNPRGIRPEPFFIKNITNSDPAVVTLVDPATSMLGDDSEISLIDVPGMPTLNGTHVSICDLHTQKEFEIDLDTHELPEFTEGAVGRGVQYIRPVLISYQPYNAALASLNFENVVLADQLEWGRDHQIVVGYAAIRRVLDVHPSLADAPFEEILAAAREIGRVGTEDEDQPLADDVNEEILGELVREFGVEIGPMVSVVGGIAGQEVIKFVTGEHTPIRQFLALNWIEALPADRSFTRHHDRYDSFRSVFGDAQQSAMAALRYFIVGAGAIGCELLKNFALMGVGTTGRLIVTDPDSIEQSNLSRQFLFHDADVGKNKAECVARAVQQINPTLRIDYQTARVDDETAATLYTRTFFEQLSGVCTALDNVPARVLTDALCCRYGRPLIDSGTEGPRASFTAFVPHITGHYVSPPEGPGQNLPVCTVHRWPTTFAHVCVWAREIFEELFYAPIRIVADAAVPGALESLIEREPREAPWKLRAAIKAAAIRPRTAADCAAWARYAFEDLFVKRIAKVLSECGDDTWTNGRNRPTRAEFDRILPDHAKFLETAAGICARVWGLDPPNEDDLTAALPFEEPPAPFGDDPAILLEQLRSVIGGAVVVHPEEFEKDDDSHMDFIVTAANVRAVSYSLKTADWLEAKRIAGRIIPAMATTTAMVCGFVCLEMYKVHSQTTKKLEDYRNGSINLACARFSFSQPESSQKFKLGTTEKEFDQVWENRDVPLDVPLDDFLRQVESTGGVKIRAIRSEGHQLWSDSDSDSGDDGQVQKTLRDVINQSRVRAKKNIKIAIDSYNPETNEDVFMPLYRVIG